MAGRIHTNFRKDNHYRMAGNFRGVLIFVVDLAVKRFSHPRKLMPTVIWLGGEGSRMMGVATNIVVARPTLPSNCHPEDSVFDTNILLSHAICPGLCRYGLVLNKERDRARVSITSSHSLVPRPFLKGPLIIALCAVPRP